MQAYKFTTTTATPALIGPLPATDFLGATASSAEAATFYLKLWWTHDSGGPIIGTTAPDATFPIPSTGLLPFEFNHPLQEGGMLYCAVTKNAADTDDTALTTGGDVVTLFLN